MSWNHGGARHVPRSAAPNVFTFMILHMARPQKSRGRNRACLCSALDTLVGLDHLDSLGSYAFTACTSTEILMSLLTRTPPVSSAWFQVRPNSRRSIVVVA